MNVHETRNILCDNKINFSLILAKFIEFGRLTENMRGIKSGLSRKAPLHFRMTAHSNVFHARCCRQGWARLRPSAKTCEWGPERNKDILGPHRTHGRRRLQCRRRMDTFFGLPTALSFNNSLCCHKSFILWLLHSQIYRLNEYNILRTNKKQHDISSLNNEKHKRI